MIEPINILHLSDLHFGMEGDVAPTAVAQRQNALASLVKLLTALERDWRPVIIAVTGDIAWRGAASEYAKAAVFLAGLATALELPRERFVLCTGNHDLDRSATVGMLPPPSAVQADDWLRVERLANLARPFAAYAEFCTQFGLGSLQVGDTEHRLVGVRNLLGLQFVVLNSAWFCRGDEDKGRLWIGLPQLELMQSHGQLADPEHSDSAPITIGLLHHPPHDLNDAENNAFGERPATYRYLAERTHLLLFGHVHGAVEKATRYFQGAFGIASGATYAGGAYRNNFSILRVSPQSRKIERRSFEFDPRHHQWRQFEMEGLSLRRAPAVVTNPTEIEPVGFQTERIPDAIDLQRALHAVLKQGLTEGDLTIPFKYDERIAMLKARIQHHYEHFREDMLAARQRPDVEVFDGLRRAIDNASYFMDTLPRQLALFAEKARQSEGMPSGHGLQRACSRLVELVMTRILASLAPYQQETKVPHYFLDYTRLDDIAEYVAKIDGVPNATIARYLITLAGSSGDELIFAPLDYGGSRGWLMRDRAKVNERHYIPPISFVTDYLLPQIAFRYWSKPEEWNLSGRCAEIFIKDNEGNYI